MRRDKGDKWADILDYYIKNFRDSLTGHRAGRARAGQ